MAEWLSSLRLRVRALLHRRQREQDLHDEVAFHLAMREEQIRTSGAADAGARARRRFGSVAKIQDDVRDTWALAPRISSLVQDVRYAARMIRRSPGFALLVVLILGLGVGINAVMFSLVNAVVVRPLPFASPDRLVRVWHLPPAAQFPGATRFSVSPANYLDWRAQNGVFEQMSIYAQGRATLTGPGQEPDSVVEGIVSAAFFDVLGARPLYGRYFDTGEDEPGTDGVVVVSEELWQTRFGGDPGLVGRSIVVDSRPRTVIGIAPALMAFPARARLWTPLAMNAEMRATRGIHDFLVLARMKTGVPIARAQAEMDTISKRLEVQYPVDNTGWGALVVPLQDDIVGDARTALLVLLGAVGFVMLIASANLANLLLAKTLGRSKEIAVRAALGASRRRVVQQILCETMLLGLLSGVFGLLLARGSMTAIVAYVTGTIPRSTEIDLDARVLLFTFGVSLTAGLIAGLAPAWRLTRPNIQSTLNQGLTRTATGSHDRRLRHALVVSEVALALVLLVGAGLLIRTVGTFRAIDPGFDRHNVLTAVLTLPPAKYPKQEDRTRFADLLTQRVGGLPGVEAVSTIDSLPMTGGSTQPVSIEGEPVKPMSEQPEVAVRRIMPGYLRASGTRLMSGRDFTKADTADALPVVLISEAMARQFWPNQNPLGKRLTLTFRPGVVREIVGVVGDVKMTGLDVPEPVAALYAPLAQNPGGPLSLVVRTTVPPKSVTPSMAVLLHELDPDLPLLNVRTMDEVVGASFAQQQFAMELLGAFAALALLLAAIGIYSVLSWTVRQRVREIGIRRALGAPTRDLIRMVVVEGLKPTVWGVVLGVASALALGRLLSALIFGVTPHDITTLSSVAIIITLVGMSATLLPAYRATRVDPVIALRDEP
ncbi:MAG TPA: ABC transporter permease [Vicinamibacterales bacterium]|nr:ABC transporter permease [Vicinamibacterales bacterium]